MKSCWFAAYIAPELEFINS